MSRVFEALTKAGREKERPSETSVSQTLDMGSEAVSHAEEPAPKTSFSPIPELSIGRNGTSKEAPLPKAVKNGKTWRERIEELFFGWDLGRYATHPIVALEEESPASEQYKILREQIKRLRTESGIRTIGITSPVKRDGKTTIAVNLAAAIALDYEQKVLLIDADLRAPSIHLYFNDKQGSGLADYLGSSSSRGIKSLIRETHLSGLSFIPAGKPSRFASELLAKEQMARLLDEVRIELPDHVVIVDSPPVLATPDPLVIGRQVDGIIMVVRAGRTPKDYLAKALSAFNENKILGVVLNGADMGLSSKYYYYYSSNGRR